MRDRLIELISIARNEYYDLSDEMHEKGMSVEESDEEYIADYLLANGVILPPCKVGDKVAVRACCECVSVTQNDDEGYYECPFENDCEYEDCDNGNERIFVTTIDGIFIDKFGQRITFKNMSIEAAFNEIGTSFFVGENVEQQAQEYNKSLEESEDKQPTADVVEVVRCKDCNYRNTEWCPFMHFEGIELIGYTEDDAFCSCGERKE